MVILSDIDGLYDGEPAIRTLMRKLIRLMWSASAAEILAVAGGAGSTVGSGGMITKIKAARVLMVAGIPMVICYGRQPRVPSWTRRRARPWARCFVGAASKPHEITPAEAVDRPRRRGARRAWWSTKARRRRSSATASFASVGGRCARVEGRFEAGDIVDIKDACGPSVRPRPCGVLARRGWSLPCGKTREELRAQPPACRTGRQRPFVHRDELVVFE